MKRLIIFFPIFICVLSLYSAELRGRITSESGEPIPFATLYIQELSSGFVADDNGYFRTTIPTGLYTFEISSLGYNKQVLKIQIPAEGLTMDISLTEHLYMLMEVEITPNREDPAYSIVRKAIANAPGFRYRVDTYTADTYLKGSGKLTDFPSLLMLSKEIKDLIDKYKDKTFLLEEQRRVTYTAPDTWENKIMAYSNTFPEAQAFSVSIETTDVNLYTPKWFGHVSPVYPGAFSYFQYKLEGCITEGDYLINKIKVIPKKDNPELVSGYLYIVEDLWCLSGIDISINNSGMSSKIKVNCHEVRPSLFLTTSISIENAFNIFGVKATAAFLSSIQYLDVQVAGNVQANGLQVKSHMTTREAYRLSKLMEKTIQQRNTIRSKYKYERQPRNYDLKKDSLADQRDSLYWERVRSVPLSEEERESYRYKKALEQDSAPDRKRKGVGAELLEIFLAGKTYQSKNKKGWLTFKNFLSIVPEYNLVDGLWLGTTFHAGYRFNESAGLRFTPQIHYTTARKEWLGSGTLSLDYAPRRLGKSWVSAGSTSSDFNHADGEFRLINSYASLFFGRSDIKFYDRKYITAGNQIELANSLLFTSILDWERRKTLTNHTNTGLFNKNEEPNIPGNADYHPMPSNDILKATFSLSYTPAHYYRMIRGRKYYENSSYPTFSVLYQQAFAHGGSKTTPSFKRAELSIEQNIAFGMFNNLQWYINGGLLWDKKDIQFVDFKHFATTKLPVTIRDLNKGFSLLHNYEMSTASRWLQTNIMWSTPYLLIKHLPFLRRKPFNEALHFRSLAVYDQKVYSELGYSLGIPQIGRFGVFVGFEKFSYKAVGVSFSLPMLKSWFN